MLQSARRHPLVLYARLFEMRRVPALSIIVVFLGLAWWAPGPLADESWRFLLLFGAAAGVLLFLYALIAPRLSYVQCRPTHLLVNTPFFPLSISYSRIYTVRPVPFEPAHVHWSQESLVQPFVGKTMVALDLKSYPVSLRWLKLLLNPFLLPNNFLGLQLLVPDWMALSRDIEAHRSQWQSRDRDRARDDALTSLLGPRR